VVPFSFDVSVKETVISENLTLDFTAFWEVVGVIQEKKGLEYCSLWYSRVDCSFFGFFSINNNLHFSFCKEVFLASY
jgi:hypothetical protein